MKRKKSAAAAAAAQGSLAGQRPGEHEMAAQAEPLVAAEAAPVVGVGPPSTVPVGLQVFLATLLLPSRQGAGEAREAGKPGC